MEYASLLSVVNVDTMEQKSSEIPHILFNKQFCLFYSTFHAYLESTHRLHSNWLSCLPLKVHSNPRMLKPTCLRHVDHYVDIHHAYRNVTTKCCLYITVTCVSSAIIVTTVLPVLVYMGDQVYLAKAHFSVSVHGWSHDCLHFLLNNRAKLLSLSYAVTGAAQLRTTYLCSLMFESKLWWHQKA